MNKALVSALLAMLLISVVGGLNAANVPPVPVEAVAVDASATTCDSTRCFSAPLPRDPTARPIRFARAPRLGHPVPVYVESVVCNVPCVKAVAKKGPLGRCRVVYVLCDCKCCGDCTGCVKVVRVGARLMKARVCPGNCCGA